MAKFEPADIQTIDDPRILRALAHPLRLLLLELLRAHGGEPRSVKEMAAALDASQTRLYYHVNLLVELGLIRVAETRFVSGIMERRYQVSAYRLTVDKSLLASDEAGQDALDVLLSVILDETRSEIKRSVQAGLIDLSGSAADQVAPGRLVIGRKWMMLTPEQVAAFDQRWKDLCADFPSSASPAEPPGDAALYEVLIGFFPALPPEEPRTEQE